MPQSDATKIENLRSLLTTLVKNTKKGVSSPSESKLIRKVLKDALGREPIDVEVMAVTPL